MVKVHSMYVIDEHRCMEMIQQAKQEVRYVMHLHQHLHKAGSCVSS
jgi:hypothetical protein